MELTEHRLLALTADVEMMRLVLAVLCVQTFPDDALDRLIDFLEIPEVGSDPLSHHVNLAAERLVERIVIERAGRRSR